MKLFSRPSFKADTSEYCWRSFNLLIIVIIKFISPFSISSDYLQRVLERYVFNKLKTAFKNNLPGSRIFKHVI